MLFTRTTWVSYQNIAIWRVNEWETFLIFRFWSISAEDTSKCRESGGIGRYELVSLESWRFSFERTLTRSCKWRKSDFGWASKSGLWSCFILDCVWTDVVHKDCMSLQSKHCHLEGQWVRNFFVFSFLIVQCRRHVNASWVGRDPQLWGSFIGILKSFVWTFSNKKLQVVKFWLWMSKEKWSEVVFYSWSYTNRCRSQGLRESPVETLPFGGWMSEKLFCFFVFDRSVQKTRQSVVNREGSGDMR